MPTSTNRHLFLDDHDVESIQDLKKIVNQPYWNPEVGVLSPEKPWEQGGISNYGTVLYNEEEGNFRFYYLVTPGQDHHGGQMVTMGGKKWLSNRTLLAYATSEDGVHWERPTLGQVDFEGSSENNLLDIGDINVEGAGVLYEPEDPDPNRRYKAIFWEHGSGEVITRDDGFVLWASGGNDGMWVAFSPDGINWTNYDGNPIGPSSDTSHYVVKDPATGKYRVYGRFAPKGGRVIGCMSSDNFVNWGDRLLVLDPDEHEVAGPESDTQFYGMSVGLYEGMYLGGVWIYRPGSDGCIDTQLAASRDGLAWERVGNRQVFLPLGPAGGYADGMVRTTANYITRDDKIYIYYGAVSGPHSGPNHPGKDIKRKGPGFVGLATLRRDGWVSLDADAAGGSIVTRPHPVDSGPLHVNVDARQGELHASLIDEQGHTLPGCEASLTGDLLDGQIAWAGPVPSSPVRIKFTLHDAKLYSYW